MATTVDHRGDRLQCVACLFRFTPLIVSFSLSFPNSSRNSDPGVTFQALLLPPPLPATSHALHFLSPEDSSLFFPRRPRVDLFN